MSIYHAKVGYKGHTNLDYELVVTSFNGDNGETNSFLSMSPIYKEKYDGTVCYDYGAKYDSVIEISLSFIKKDQTYFTLQESRELMSWFTGSVKVSWLDLYDINDSIEYSILGRFIDVKPYKLDDRVIGFVCTFRSIHPWAYSDVQTINVDIINSVSITIENRSDDLYNYIYPDLVFKNRASSDSLLITNLTTEDKIKLLNIASNEVITMSGNQIIYSDNQYRIFGDDFNYIWLRLAPGINNIDIAGNGQLTISYRYIIKAADMITDLINT